MVTIILPGYQSSQVGVIDNAPDKFIPSIPDELHSACPSTSDVEKVTTQLDRAELCDDDADGF